MRAFKLLTLTAAFTTCLYLASAGLAHAASMSAEEFAQKVIHANEFEVQSSHLALQKAEEPEVRAFAQKMITEHTEANQSLEAIVKAADIDVEMSKELDVAHMVILDDLRTNEAFDRNYLAAQDKAHSETIALFNAYAESGDNKPLRDLAHDTLPKLREHASEVTALQNGVR